MAVPRSIEELPLEVLECIVGNLSDEDLSRCCTVSKTWRQVFSDDFLWKKRCDIKLAVYLESARCLVKPYFTTPHVENSNLMPVSGWQLCFLREQHFLNNLRTGRYKKKKIKFGVDIETWFATNDYLFLHGVLEIHVWHVAKKPTFVMRIPSIRFNNVMDENIICRFHDNKLVVITCKVVQIFNICFLSKTWSWHRTFFYDKPEEFSLNIFKDTNVNDFYNKTYNEDDITLYNRGICGNFLFGINEGVSPIPILHIWDLDTCKKIKEEDCSEFLGSGVTAVYSLFPTSKDKIIIVSCQGSQKQCVVVYSLVMLKCIASHLCHRPILYPLLYDEYLFYYDNWNNEIWRYNLVTKVEEHVTFKFGPGEFNMQVVCDKIVVANSKGLFVVNPLSKTVEAQFIGDFRLRGFHVLNDKYLALFHKDFVFELWEYQAKDKFRKNKRNTFTKVLSLPPDYVYYYRAASEACTKIFMVNDSSTGIHILNFW